MDAERLDMALKDLTLEGVILASRLASSVGREDMPLVQEEWKTFCSDNRSLIIAALHASLIYKQERKPTPKPIRFHLNEKLDELKSGQWWLWSCTATMSDGTEREGSVQSDGHMIAEETFEACE
jgi:hypothetical protein